MHDKSQAGTCQTMPALTLWKARSCPSSARVTTHGMSRYTPLSKLPGCDSLLRGPMHTQCCMNT